MTLKQLRKQYGEDNVSGLCRGFRTIRKDGKTGIYSHKAEKMITGFDYETLGGSYLWNVVTQRGEGGSAFANIKKGGKYAYADVYDGRIDFVTDFIYDEPVDFGGRSKTIAKVNGKYGVIEDYNRQQALIPFEYEIVRISGAGIALRKNGKWGYFTATGKPKLPKKVTGNDPFIWDEISIDTGQWSPLKFYIDDIGIKIYKEDLKPAGRIPYLFIKKLFKEL